MLSLKDSYSQGLKNASNETESFGNRLKGMVAPLAALAAGFASFKSIESAISTTQKLGSEVSKLSRETGLGAKDASELLSVFKHFGQTGDDASRSLGIFSKNLTIAHEETLGFTTSATTTQKLFQSLGVTAESAGGQMRPLNDVLLDVADKFKTLPNGAEKTGLAMQLFGKSGKDMIPILNQGREGLTELEKAAAKFGVSLTTANLDAIRKYTFAQRDMGEAINGVKLQVGLTLMPVLTQFANWLTEHQGDIRKFIAEAIPSVQGVAEAFATGLSAMKEPLTWLEENAGRIALGVGAIGLAFAWANPGGAAMVGLVGLTTTAGLFMTANEELSVQMLKVKLSIIDMAFVGADAFRTFGQIVIAVVLGPLQSFINAVNSIIKGINSLPNIPGLGNTNLPKLPDVQKDISQTFDQGLGNMLKPLAYADAEAQDALEKALQKVKDGAIKAEPPLAGVGDGLTGLGDKAQKVKDALKTAMNDVIAAGTQLFAKPTREFASLDLVLTQEVEAHRSLRPAIQDAIDAYNLDATAHEDAARAIEDSAARMDEVLQVQIDQAQQHVQNLQDQFAKEDELRSNANRAAQRAQEDRAAADDANSRATQRRLQDQLDSLRDQKDALPGGAEGADQRDALDKQINTLQDSLTKASRAAQDQSTALSEANRQLDRANEDAQAKVDAARKKASDEAAASLAWQQAQKKKADDDAKKAAEQERIEAGKAKDAAEGEKRKLDQMDKEEAAMKLRLDALTGEHEIMKKRLVLADASLLTEGQLKAKVDALIPETATLTTRIMNAATALGVDLVGGVRTLITELDKLKDLPASILAGLTGGQGVPGHAMGLPRVPYDNYLMFAHKDERVLTADEARAYNQHNDNSRRSYGATYNYYGSAGDSMELARLN